MLCMRGFVQTFAQRGSCENYWRTTRDGPTKSERSERRTAGTSYDRDFVPKNTYV